MAVVKIESIETETLREEQRSIGAGGRKTGGGKKGDGEERKGERG